MNAKVEVIHPTPVIIAMFAFMFIVAVVGKVFPTTEQEVPAVDSYPAETAANLAKLEACDKDFQSCVEGFMEFRDGRIVQFVAHGPGFYEMDLRNFRLGMMERSGFARNLESVTTPSDPQWMNILREYEKQFP